MNAVLFFAYGSVSKVFEHTNQGEDLSLLQVTVAVGVAGLASAFVTGPTELIKCIAQTNLKTEGHIREEYEIVKNMVQRHGLFGSHGLSRGLLTTIAREIPSMSLYFGLYEGICRSCKSYDSRLVSFFAGGTAGACAWASIYPIDVIKTRWSTAAQGTYSSVYHCFRSSVAGEGTAVLWKGFSATMLRAWPQNAVLFLTYEQVKLLLQ